MITTIIAFSIIMWYAIDRLKAVWSKLPHQNYITMAVALIAGEVLAFTYGLDLLVALNVTDTVSIGGYIFAGVALMAGSSGINELIAKFNK